MGFQEVWGFDPEEARKAYGLFANQINDDDGSSAPDEVRGTDPDDRQVRIPATKTLKFTSCGAFFGCK